jgi:hypothetical protein
VAGFGLFGKSRWGPPPATDTTSASSALDAGEQTLGLSAPVAAIVAGAVILAAGANVLALSNDATRTATVTLAADGQTVGLSASSAAASPGTSTIAAGANTLALSNDATLSPGAVTLAAGGQVLAVIAPDAGISQAGGAQTLTATAQTLALGAPDPTISAGAVSLAAGEQALAVIAPDATVVQASNQTLTADAAVLSMMVPDAGVIATVPTVTDTTSPSEHAYMYGLGRTRVIGWPRRPAVSVPFVEAEGDIAVSVHVDVSGRASVIANPVVGSGVIELPRNVTASGRAAFWEKFEMSMLSDDDLRVFADLEALDLHDGVGDFDWFVELQHELKKRKGATKV